MHAGHDDDPPIYEFGWWPELIGAVATLAIIALMIGLSDGTL